MPTRESSPLEVLAQDVRPGQALGLAPELATLYGELAFPAHPGRPYVIGNFVSTLDGVVTLGAAQHSGGGDISGKNQQDRIVMGLLRAIADVVIVGAGTLRAEPRHIWTADRIAPEFAAAYATTRSLLGKHGAPCTVLVTASADVDLSLPVFQSGATTVYIATDERAARGLTAKTLPQAVRVLPLPGEGAISVASLLEALAREVPSDVILTEGGPRLMGDFLAERCLDELFLTLAPQVAGRADPARRPGFAGGHEFAPTDPRWSTLVDVRRGGSHLFLRYAFSR